MIKKFALLFCLLAVGLWIGSQPAMSQQQFFSDLGPPGNAYQSYSGWQVSGNQNPLQLAVTEAFQFSSIASGEVSQIDLGVGYYSGENSFYAAIYTNDNGLPGTELERWSNLSSTQNYPGCCGLVTITGVTGLNLLAGQQYFLVLGATDPNSATLELWAENNQNVNTLQAESINGGSWVSGGEQPTGAFDVLGTTPEPSSLLLLGTGIVGALATVRRTMHR